MIELNLLKALSNRDSLNQYRNLINDKTLSSQSVFLLKDFLVYFEMYRDIQDIDFNVFSSFFFTIRHPYLDEKSIIEYREIISRLNVIENTEHVHSLLNSFKQQEFYHDLVNKIERNEPITNINRLITSFMDNSESIDLLNTDMDLEAALSYVDRADGLKWRCHALNEHFSGGLIKGDFILVAASVDAGKTSFCASEGSYMAEQLDGSDSILWLSNEGDWKSILPRVYCASLNCTLNDLTSRRSAAMLRYTEKMKGDKNRLQIVDIQGWNTSKIEDLLKQKKPKLLIIDLLDHVLGFDKYLNKENSTEKYNQLYQWAREIATKHCPVIGVSQMNKEGYDSMYPPMTALRGSAIDKQAAATAMIFIGALEGDASTRFLSTPKNKINANKNWKAQVSFNPTKSRFE